MASKRKLEEDAETFATPSKTQKMLDEVKRSGRVRKKPARFKDTGEESDEDGEIVKTPKSPESVSPGTAKSVPSPKGAPTVTVPFILKPDAVASPAKGPKPKAIVAKSPGVIMIQNPSLLGTGAETNPLVVSPHVVSVPTVAPVTVPVVVQSPVIPPVQSPVTIKAKTQTSQSADFDNKSGRVRKKSKKVLEMEAFEEAERIKTTTKKVPETKGSQKSPAARKSGHIGIVGKAADTVLTAVTLTGLSQGVAAEVGKLTAVKMEPAEQMLDTSIPPQALPQPAIPGKMDPALANLPPFPPSKLGTLSKPAIPGKIDPVLANLPPFPPSKLGNSSKKGKKKKDDIGPITTPPLIAPASPIVAGAKKVKTTPKAKKSKQQELMEVEPHLMGGAMSVGVTEEQDIGVLQSGSLSDSSVKVKTEPTSPGKTVKRGLKGSPSAIDPSLIETGIRMPQSIAGQSGSVIKMLLNTPTQFSSPTVSTQSINTSEKAQKLGTSPEAMDTSIVKSEAMYLGDESTILLSTDIMEHTETVGDEDVYDKKKQKKIIKKTILMDPMDDDEDDDDLDDLDDDDDDFDNGDEAGEWEFENQDGKLVIADFPKKGNEELEEDKQAVDSNKGKKSPKRPTPKKRPQSKGKADGADADGEQGDGKKGGKAAKEKKKKRLTAYTMWCNTVRNKVLSENQGMDFAQLSRRLGEIWQGLPAKAKMAWKRKAKREARKLMGKGLLISTSKGGGGVITTTIPSSHAMSAAAAAAAANTTAHATPTQQATPAAQPVKVITAMREEPATTKAFGIEPIDVSAHLKLVGESLGIIGMRLQEHRGLIAVQGSLSVLLDSMLCALGPLMCLTTQIPEMNGCSDETHSRTLDNVAFFMPGL
ncbi:HMG box-containing protein 4-like [Mizuhopecten yessoensis]|uniref:HMG domain-containing protein 4 n=1 Tax=Mizuhopecten yessoensis TaxID=6573 RepID=A0A210R277_MIZYE|nr:HMG box-containing protein 4-like [Mizuhopecten yessoensis]OWF55005.1 HMG domain-containing protein 4 [Mizuhopecten yessoensis]